jgi:hypothetical protein
MDSVTIARLWSGLGAGIVDLDSPGASPSGLRKGRQDCAGGW